MYTDRPPFPLRELALLTLPSILFFQPCTIAIAQQKQRTQKHPPGTNAIRTAAKGLFSVEPFDRMRTSFPLTIEGTIDKNFINTWN
jgi:hypothetical protein